MPLCRHSELCLQSVTYYVFVIGFAYLRSFMSTDHILSHCKGIEPTFSSGTPIGG